MSVGTHTEMSAEPRWRFRVGLRASMVAVPALVIVAVLMLLDTAHVQTRQGLERVSFGVPLTWMTQNQGLDPPLPYDTRFISPWEYPATIDWVMLLLDVMIVGSVLTGVLIGLLALRTKRSPA